MPVWSSVAIDYSKGVHKEGKLSKGNVIGCFVMTMEEAKEANKERIKNGR
jgi:hypothetical protein